MHRSAACLPRLIFSSTGGGATTQRAHDLALATYGLLGLEGFGRVDLMLEEATGELFVLEANATPGLTETSLLPQAAEAEGIGLDELIGRITELALAGGAVGAPH